MMRCCANVSNPKHHHKKFWRQISARLLALANLFRQSIYEAETRCWRWFTLTPTKVTIPQNEANNQCG